MIRLQTAVAAVATSPPVTVLAAEPTINTVGVLAWIAKFIFPILFGLAALLIMTRAAQNRQQTKDSMNVGLNMFIGLMFFGAAGTLFAFGQQFVQLILG